MTEQNKVRKLTPEMIKNIGQAMPISSNMLAGNTEKAEELLAELDENNGKE